ncbi:MAG: hypothetical protein VB066_02285 [Paludibacter sp.]|nr:hypothetical protein [Paludibacter sp.]
MDNEKFLDFVNTQSQDFSSIIEVMYHSHKSDAKEFLCAMNNVINYSLNKPVTEDGKINYQIIHIPNCPEWARPLLVRFVIHKIAFTFNNTILNKIRELNSHQGIITLSSNQGTNDYKKIQAKRTYLKKIVERFSNIPINNNKSLIIIKAQDNITTAVDRNPWIENLYTSNVSDADYNLILSTDKTASDLESDIRTIRKTGTVPIIENIFLFHSSNKTSITNSYNVSQLERLNKYGLGIKNCIVFSFSKSPFRLYHTIENIKLQLTSSLLNRKVTKYNDFDGFITFTQEETNYLFNKEDGQSLHIVNNPQRQLFTFEIDSVLEQVDHNLHFKNLLSLSFTTDLQQSFIKELSQEISFDPNSFNDFFNLLRQTWNNEIKPIIENFINSNNAVAFIISNDIPSNIKRFLKNAFTSSTRHITFHSIDELKKGIKEKQIVIFQYKYIKYKSYPNSFDPIPLRNEQQVLLIINRLTHNNYYEWDQYRYDKSYNGLLFSFFRKSYLRWNKKLFQKPSLPDVNSYIDEDETDNRAYQTEKCIIHFADGHTRSFLACDHVLYKQNGVLFISELKDLHSSENIQIQMLDDIIEQVKILTTKKTIENTTAGEYIKKDPRFHLSDDEINSSVELWKVLLKRKIEEFGLQKVYNQIFPTKPDISLNSFAQWSNFDSPMILPRSRSSQKALLTYLGFELGSPYHRIVLTKKILSKNNSQNLNSQIGVLLQSILTRPVEDLKFDSIMESNSDILTLLEIKNSGDIKSLIDLLDITTANVTQIEYDKD